MRPLLLHASSKAINGPPRRVLHFVFGPSHLPEGFRWPARDRRQLELPAEEIIDASHCPEKASNATFSLRCSVPGIS
jgi:hypothetical protein